MYIKYYKYQGVQIYKHIFIFIPKENIRIRFRRLKFPGRTTRIEIPRTHHKNLNSQDAPQEFNLSI